MSSSYGENIRLTIFGQSHSKGIGMTLEGVPAGHSIDEEELARFMGRRAPGRSAYSTARSEADSPVFLGGVVDGVTCGTPIAAVIMNTDTRSGDYDKLRSTPRPGHADYTAAVKYFGAQDYAGGGHFSGRMTAPLCIAGGICLQLLAEAGITVMARIASIGGIKDSGSFVSPVSDKEFPVVCDADGEKMKQLILAAKAEGDSVGGVVECIAEGIEAGLGDPMFDGMENRIASIVFGIPAVKGVEFGAGFASAQMRGSESNDPFIIKDGRIITETNNSGGIQGGITNGMPVVFRAAFKPTPSIARPQRTVDMNEMKETEITVGGRHDPCIVPRAVPCVEAAAAIAIYDAYLGRRREVYGQQNR